MAKKHSEPKNFVKLGVLALEVEQFLLEKSKEMRELQELADKDACGIIDHNKLARFRKNPARLEKLAHTIGADHAGITRVLRKAGVKILTGSSFIKYCKNEGIALSARGARGRS